MLWTSLQQQIVITHNIQNITAPLFYKVSHKFGIMFMLLWKVFVYSAATNVVTAIFFVDINDCIPVPCQNGGSCTDEVNGYTCTCLAGYTGADCQIGLLNISNIVIS